MSDPRGQGLIEALARGELGLTLRFPEAWSVRESDAGHAAVDDVEGGVGWWVGIFPDVHLEPSERELPGLLAAAHHHARFMFEWMHARDEGNDQPPRTADPEWSPLVSFERDVLQGSEVVWAVHRMRYRPGHELMMGHLLVPRPWGLFDARVITVDRTTGLRESLTVEKLVASGMLELGPGIRIPQSTFDDPALDDVFAHHCLSRARTALRWLKEESGLVLDPVELPRVPEEVTVPPLGCALRLPPRFFPLPRAPGCFRRTSFCGTDGLEHLFVQQEARARMEHGLSHYAAESTRASHQSQGVTDIELHVEEHLLRSGVAGVVVVVDGQGHQGALRNAVCWWLDETKQPWSLALISTQAIARETLVAELVASARSWRRVG
ncbi:hypothetical protein [Paraliomyxa miuraensis]|uniref:hypothetical protein n=1 Tax=Paraliomyxa miuraensis TaxID=376150 RepID=UPI0022588C0F|nr:hypothetical protein [Paraliomyxa miuraensis]MCX4240161.1 hypothetical protein [Paraliomyxa miuraensis]